MVKASSALTLSYYHKIYVYREFWSKLAVHLGDKSTRLPRGTRLRPVRRRKKQNFQWDNNFATRTIAFLDDDTDEKKNTTYYFDQKIEIGFGSYFRQCSVERLECWKHSTFNSIYNMWKLNLYRTAMDSAVNGKSLNTIMRLARVISSRKYRFLFGDLNFIQNSM